MLKIKEIRIAIKLIIFISVFDAGFLIAQNTDQSNLEIYYSLIDSSIADITNKIPSQQNEISLEIVLPDNYSVFRNRIVAGFEKTGKNIRLAGSAGNLLIQYSFNDARISYSDVFRDGILGSYKIKRNITINGDYSIIQDSKLIGSDRYTLASDDTIGYDDIRKAESSFDFTRGNIPAEPFFASLLEPVLAVSAAAITVYLFFSIRSK